MSSTSIGGIKDYTGKVQYHGERVLLTKRLVSLFQKKVCLGFIQKELSSKTRWKYGRIFSFNEFGVHLSFRQNIFLLTGQ